MNNIIKLTSFIYLLSLSAMSVHAADDLAGTLAALEEKGITLEASYIFEYADNLSGGAIQDSTYQDNFLAGVGLDGEKFGMPGASFYFNLLGNNGHNPSPSTMVGDAQGVSNIEAPDKWQINEAWYEQAIGESFSIKLGHYDLNSEFDAIDTAGLFLNSSHGIGPDISQTGPSIFPELFPGVRLAYSMANGRYLQAAYIDNTYVDPDDKMVAVEYGKLSEEGKKLNRYAIGLWYYTNGVTADINGTPISETNNQGFYALYETGLSEDLNAYIRYGVADDDLNQFSSYLGLGAVYTGLFDGRAEDQLGLAVAIASNSSTYKNATPTATSGETNIELSYRMQVNDWFAVQPDIQYVIDPGADNGLNNATLFMLRVEAGF